MDVQKYEEIVSEDSCATIPLGKKGAINAKHRFKKYELKKKNSSDPACAVGGIVERFKYRTAGRRVVGA